MGVPFQYNALRAARVTVMIIGGGEEDEIAARVGKKFTREACREFPLFKI